MASSPVSTAGEKTEIASWCETNLGWNPGGGVVSRQIALTSAKLNVWKEVPRLISSGRPEVIVSRNRFSGLFLQLPKKLDDLSPVSLQRSLSLSLQPFLRLDFDFSRPETAESESTKDMDKDLRRDSQILTE
jgi:hypothetical protein